jgi:hypothetical protein
MYFLFVRTFHNQVGNICICEGHQHLPFSMSFSTSCRVAFWQQVTAQQQPQAAEQLSHWQRLQLGSLGGLGSKGDSTLSRQLHQLAWSSILLASSTRAEQHQQQEQPKHCPGLAGQGASGPGAALRQKLHTYLAAHMQWRQQQQYAPPLAPAEKWVTLEHEEQVGDVGWWRHSLGLLKCTNTHQRLSCAAIIRLQKPGCCMQSTSIASWHAVLALLCFRHLIFRESFVMTVTQGSWFTAAVGAIAGHT